MAAAMMAMSATAVGPVCDPASVRSSQPVSAEAEMTSSRSSRLRRKDLVVVPPSMTTVVSRRALRKRAKASLRSRPQAMTLATIES